jgi:hypothetical protein
VLPCLHKLFVLLLLLLLVQFFTQVRVEERTAAKSALLQAPAARQF